MNQNKITIRHEVHFDNAPSDVWVAISDPHALAEWFEPNDHSPEVGHRFRFMVDGACKDCEVVEADPPRRLAWEWNDVSDSETANESSSLPMTISWTIVPQEIGCSLTLEHHGAESMGLLRRQLMRFGWKYMMKRSLPKILTHIENGVFVPGAVPLEKRFYRCRTVPEQYVR